MLSLTEARKAVVNVLYNRYQGNNFSEYIANWTRQSYKVALGNDNKRMANLNEEERARLRQHYTLVLWSLTM